MVKKIFITLILMLSIFSLKETKAVFYGEYMETLRVGVKYEPIGNFAPDSTNDMYYSQTYIASEDRLEILRYSIKSIEGFPDESFIVNAVTGERQTEFGAKDKRFKIMVPKEKAESDFIGKIKISLEFKAVNVYYSAEGELQNQYVENSNEQDVILDNRNSDLSIKINDVETYEGIEGVKLEVEDAWKVKTEKNTAENYGYAYIEKISEGQANIKLLEVPSEYKIVNKEYTVDIGYKKNEYYQIDLKHKKGKMHLTDNAKNATFQIYDSDINLVGVYETDDNGEIEIEELNTGKYLLIQKEVDEAYYRTENEYFTVEEDKTCEVNITNLEKPKQEETEKQEPNEDNHEDGQVDKDQEQEKTPPEGQDKDQEQEKTPPEVQDQTQENQIPEGQDKDQEQEKTPPEVQDQTQENQIPEGQDKDQEQEKTPTEGQDQTQENQIPEEQEKLPEKEQTPEGQEAGKNKTPEVHEQEKEQEDEKDEEKGKDSENKQEQLSEEPDKSESLVLNDKDEEQKIPEESHTNQESSKEKQEDKEIENNDSKQDEIGEEKAEENASKEDKEEKREENNETKEDKENDLKEENNNYNKNQDKIETGDLYNAKDMKENMKNEKEQILLVKNENEQETDNREKNSNENNETQSQILQDKNDEKINMAVLPRTGNDYFEIKLILINSIILISYILIQKRKQTVKKQSALSKKLKG